MKQAKICMHCKKLPASGVWNATFKLGYTKPMLLCASCGLTEFGNRVIMYVDGVTGESRFMRDVARVDFVAHISRSVESYQPKMFNDATGKVWSLDMRREANEIVQYRVAKDYNGTIVQEFATGERWPAAK